jgi:hypothetical protein
MPIWGITASAMSGHLSSFESIATVTVGAGGSSTISFSSIPSTYTHLQIRLFGLVTSSANLTIRLNGDTGTNYIGGHQMQGDGSSVQVNYSSTNTSCDRLGLYINSSSYPGASIIDILDVNLTSKYKTIRALTGSDGNGTGTATDWRIGFHSGAWMSTSAVTSIDIISASWRQYTTAALYGVKA